jgi:hypothetical protein
MKKPPKRFSLPVPKLSQAMLDAFQKPVEEIIRANDLRLERQAERLIARGYRIGELINVVKPILQQKPPKFEDGKLSMYPRGDIQPIADAPPAWILRLRRAWRMFFPYKPLERNRP